jgi:phosphatidylserine decarboxylase
MKTQRLFLLGKLALFMLVTFFAYSLISSFPDLPPAFRKIIRKGGINIARQGNTKVDKRFLKWFDRDPERQVPSGPGLIVSPADGIVVHIGLLEGKQHIVIEMRYTDVHVQRIPLDGDVIKIEGGGEKLPAGTSPYKYATEKMLPYQKRTVFKTEIGEIAVRQITSLFASRIEVFIRVGEKVKKGQRLGRVLAGSTVVLEIPVIIKVLATINQEVIGGETIIAKY